MPAFTVPFGRSNHVKLNSSILIGILTFQMELQRQAWQKLNHLCQLEKAPGGVWDVIILMASS